MAHFPSRFRKASSILAVLLTITLVFAGIPQGSFAANAIGEQAVVPTTDEKPDIPDKEFIVLADTSDAITVAVISEDEIYGSDTPNDTPSNTPNDNPLSDVEGLEVVEVGEDFTVFEQKTARACLNPIRIASDILMRAGISKTTITPLCR